MNRLLIILFISISIISCTEEELPKPDSGKLSNVVGDYIYTIVAGSNQTGYPGQILDQEIKIIVTDLNGKSVYRSLQFELSDETGKLNGSYFNNSDTVIISWKLGCNEQEQTITVTDNVCGIAKSGCIDAKIFKISAKLSDNIASGWYSPCAAFEGENNSYYSQLLVSDNRMVVCFEDRIFSTIDPLKVDWTMINSGENSYSSKPYSILSNGEVLLFGSRPRISNWSEAKWDDISLPVSFGEISMEISDNGYYYLISEYNSGIFRSRDLNNWSTVFYLGQYTGYNNSKPQALAMDGNDFYILVDGRFVLKVNASTAAVETFEFPVNSWGYYSDIEDFQLEVRGNNLIFYSLYDNTLVVLNLLSKSITKNILDRYSRLVKSENEVYLMQSPTRVQKWNGFNFTLKEYPSIEFSNNNYTEFNFYKGSPVLIDNDELYYYVN